MVAVTCTPCTAERSEWGFGQIDPGRGGTGIYSDKQAVLTA